MTRVQPYRSCAVIVCWLGACVGLRAQADPEWLRLWDRSQALRPVQLSRVAHVVSPGEPGVPLVVHGSVFEPDGTTPAAGVVVFAYQTDRSGAYVASGEAGAPWRLKGWARTDASGRFELRTIRPGAYPNRAEPAHIHVVVESQTRGRQWAQALHFDDDPLVGAKEKRRSAGQQPFGSVCPVRMDGGVAHVDFAVRLKPHPDF